MGGTPNRLAFIEPGISRSATLDSPALRIDFTCHSRSSAFFVVPRFGNTRTLSPGEARRRGLSVEARHALRQEKAKPLLDAIRYQIEAARSNALPASALAKACQYTLTLWEKLTRFLRYPELELSNNQAENSMRPIALGRTNWIHVGSPQAGPKIAAIL